MDRAICWTVVGLATVASIALCYIAGLSYPFGALHLPAVAATLILYVKFASHSWPLALPLIIASEVFSQFMLLGASTAVSSYAIAALTTGWADDGLAACDEALGFDWVALFKFMGRHPVFGVISNAAYCSFFLTPLAMIAWGVRERHRPALRKLVFAYAVALMATLVVFAMVPARTALGHYHADIATYGAVVNTHQDILIAQLRSGAVTFIDEKTLSGLINFPSFHAAHAVLMIWASASIAKLRWWMLAINGTMLLSTPIEGSHYLVDVLGGIAIAAASALLAERVFSMKLASRTGQHRMAAA